MTGPPPLFPPPPAGVVVSGAVLVVSGVVVVVVGAPPGGEPMSPRSGTVVVPPAPGMVRSGGVVAVLTGASLVSWSTCAWKGTEIALVSPMIQTWLKTARVGSSSNPGWVSLKKLSRAGGTEAAVSVSSSVPVAPPVVA